MDTAYKIYAEVIRKRLEIEAEEKKMLLESQTGFTKGRSTMDNIFVLNNLVQREQGKEGKEQENLCVVCRFKSCF